MLAASAFDDAEVWFRGGPTSSGRALAQTEKCLAGSERKGLQHEPSVFGPAWSRDEDKLVPAPAEFVYYLA